MTENKYVTYYRVSTQKQGQSGLGLDAQKTAVNTFLKGITPIAEFTDIESGKSNNRPELQKALSKCISENGILLIAKLDRLSRNLTFISTLMDNKVRFICCDMPDANEMTIHIFASLAQWERKKISERTTGALQELKKRGVKLGNPQNLTSKAQAAGAAAVSKKAAENPNNKQAAYVIKLLQSTGKSLTEIAKELNEAGYKTSQGKEFKPMQVSRLIKH